MSASSYWMKTLETMSIYFPNTLGEEKFDEDEFVREIHTEWKSPYGDIYGNVTQQKEHRHE